MKKLIALLMALALCLSMVALAEAPTEDRAGNPIALPEKVEKIVSLAPSTSQVLIDIGLADKIIAIDTYTAVYEPSLADLPQFDMMTPDVEQLAALEPDVIFITGMSLSGGDNPYQSLIDLGIPVVEVPSSNTLADVALDTAFIGACVGEAEAAQNLADTFEAELEAVKAMGEGVAEKKTVAIEISALPYLYYAGGGSYMDEMIQLIGAVNAYGDQPAWAGVTEEAAVAANPDVILTASYYLEDPVGEILGREGWGEVAAVANGEVYAVDDSINRPNHRLTAVLWEMLEVVYPDLFQSEAA